MKQRDIVITFEDLAYDELPADELALVEAAREATQLCPLFAFPCRGGNRT